MNSLLAPLRWAYPQKGSLPVLRTRPLCKVLGWPSGHVGVPHSPWLDPPSSPPMQIHLKRSLGENGSSLTRSPRKELRSQGYCVWLRVSGTGGGHDQGSRARAFLAVVDVFFIEFSSGNWRRGGHRRPPSFRPRRAGLLPVPTDAAVGSDELVRTGPGWRPTSSCSLPDWGCRRLRPNSVTVGRGSAPDNDARTHGRRCRALKRLPSKCGTPKTENCRPGHPWRRRFGRRRAPLPRADG